MNERFFMVRPLVLFMLSISAAQADPIEINAYASKKIFYALARAGAPYEIAAREIRCLLKSAGKTATCWAQE